MRYQIEAGTDAAMLLLFDPTALPDDFDERSKEYPAIVAHLTFKNSLANPAHSPTDR